MELACRAAAVGLASGLPPVIELDCPPAPVAGLGERIAAGHRGAALWCSGLPLVDRSGLAVAADETALGLRSTTFRPD